MKGVWKWLAADIDIEVRWWPTWERWREWSFDASGYSDLWWLEICLGPLQVVIWFDVRSWEGVCDE